MDFEQPGKIIVALIGYIKCTDLKIYLVQDFNVMYLSVRNVNKHRDIAP